MGGKVTKIKLCKRVLDHIVARHPEVKAYTHKIVETIRNPDMLVMGVRGAQSIKVLSRDTYRTKIPCGCLS